MNILLTNNLKNNGLKEKGIVSDNNCQFHAIVDQCLQNGITGWDHKKLRIAAVEWLKKNKEMDAVTFFNTLRLKKKKTMAFAVHENWKDIGIKIKEGKSRTSTPPSNKL